MPDLTAPDYTIARLVIERGLALIYLIAFVVAARQFPALCGERGLQPASWILSRAGFLAIFLGNAEVAPPWLMILAFRWLAVRVEFGAGLIKLRGDPCWRDLTCMDFHHETQPMPNPLSWFFHHLPRPLHRIEVLGNFLAQLILPFGLFLPQPIATAA